jgi:predicted metal-dependent hydrolase
MRRLRADAARIADHFGLNYTAVEAENARVKRRYGSCHSDGRIKIRLNHVRTGRPLKYSSMIATLCHELAHLKHFDHGIRFQILYEKILRWARGQGIYRPGPERGTPAQPRATLQPATAVQLGLFSE